MDDYTVATLRCDLSIAAIENLIKIAENEAEGDERRKAIAGYTRDIIQLKVEHELLFIRRVRAGRVSEELERSHAEVNELLAGINGRMALLTLPVREIDKKLSDAKIMLHEAIFESFNPVSKLIHSENEVKGQLRMV